MLTLLVTGVKISEQLRKDGSGSWEGQGEVACSSPGFWKVGVIGAQFRVDRSLPDVLRALGWQQSVQVGQVLGLGSPTKENGTVQVTES